MNRRGKVVFGLAGAAVVAVSLVQLRHSTSAGAVEAAARSSLRSIIDGHDVLQGSTSEPLPKVGESVRRTLTGQPVVRIREDSGGYWHVDFCFGSGSHVYMGVFAGSPPLIADLWAHQRGEGQHPFEPCR